MTGAPPRTPRRAAPPPVPSRRSQDYPTTPMYRTPGIGYGGGMYGSGMGMYGGGYGGAYGSQYSRGPVNNFVRLAEDSSRPAFESMGNIVQAFGSIAMVLESTSFAVQSSFRAVLSLAEHFSRLRLQLKQTISTFTLFRTLRYLYRKLLVFLKLRTPTANGENDEVWNELASSTESLFKGKGRRKSSWPLMLFFCIVIGGPYIIWRFMASMNEEIVTDTTWMSGEGEHFVAVADYDYDGENEDELSFNGGQEIRVAPKDLQPRIRGWLLASVNGEKSGLIPANYVRVRGRRPARTPASSSRPPPVNTSHDTVWNEVMPGSKKKLQVDVSRETETSSANESEGCSPLPPMDSGIGSDHKESEIR